MSVPAQPSSTSSGWTQKAKYIHFHTLKILCCKIQQGIVADTRIVSAAVVACLPGYALPWYKLEKFNRQNFFEITGLSWTRLYLSYARQFCYALSPRYPHIRISLVWRRCVTLSIPAYCFPFCHESLETFTGSGLDSWNRGSPLASMSCRSNPWSCQFKLLPVPRVRWNGIASLSTERLPGWTIHPYVSSCERHWCRYSQCAHSNAVTLK